MAMELTPENALKAFIAVLRKIGIKIKEGEWSEAAVIKIYDIVPQEFHDTLPNRFLQSARSVCEEEPYNWLVSENEYPDINGDTTLGSLFDDWFTRIIS